MDSVKPLSSKIGFSSSPNSSGGIKNSILKQNLRSFTSTGIFGNSESLFKTSGSIWNESRFVLRAWALSITIFGFLLLLALADGRLAVIQGAGNPKKVIGYWTNCQRHACPDLHKVTVSKHLGMGFMILALGSQMFCIFFMSLSFQPIFRRISRCDLVFGILNFNTGFLISLSMLLFSLECWTLYPIKFIYITPYYMCWGSSLMQYLSGMVCLINHKHSFIVPFTWPLKVSRPPLATSSMNLPNMHEVARKGRRRTNFQILLE